MEIQHLVLFLISFLLVAGFPTCLGVYEHIRHSAPSPSSAGQEDTYPYFDSDAIQSNVSAFVGQTLHLHCVVRDLGDRTVSWIRKSDLHVLTSGLITFTGDQRFSSHHQRDSDVWTMQIKFTQIRDAGEFQCQVNTEPKLSYSVFLKVSEARAHIDSPSNKEVHVRQRSRVKLTCAVDLGEHASGSAVFWYLDGQALDWLGQTGPGRGVQVTEVRGKQLVSTLLIERADARHAGKFTCAPSYAKEDTVTLHVVDGESRAELQGNSASRSLHRMAPSAIITINIIGMLLAATALRPPRPMWRPQLQQQRPTRTAHAPAAAAVKAAAALRSVYNIFILPTTSAASYFFPSPSSFSEWTRPGDEGDGDACAHALSRN